ncbi:hypothetical protein HZS_1623 [Henneguya salminicola]|nr:hypothetical protein HZS_1623 [Henneguya salminicola]
MMPEHNDGDNNGHDEEPKWIYNEYDKKRLYNLKKNVELLSDVLPLKINKKVSHKVPVLKSTLAYMKHIKKAIEKANSFNDKREEKLVNYRQKYDCKLSIRLEKIRPKILCKNHYSPDKSKLIEISQNSHLKNMNNHSTALQFSALFTTTFLIKYKNCGYYLFDLTDHL